MIDAARRARAIPESQTVGIADLATALLQQGHPIVDMSAGRAAEHTPAYIRDAAVAALAAGDTHQTLSVGGRRGWRVVSRGEGPPDRVR